MKKITQIILLLGIIFFSSETKAQWNQIGIDIDGEAVGDQSGWSVSMSADGLTVAIGAQDNDGGFSNAGHVRVYTLTAGVWTQLGGDINGEAADDESGTSVSMSADGLTVAIGARLNDGSFSNAGHVRVYKLIAGVWTQQGLDIDGEAAGDQSGWSVSMSTDGLTVAIGAISNDGTASNAGHVRVYKLITGVWTQQGLDIDGEAAGDNSGFSVSMSDDGLSLAIGATLNSGSFTDAGHVRVYKLITGVWTQQGVDIDGEAAGDESGGAVSTSADGLTVAIGAQNNDGNFLNAGHVRVYKLTAGVWTQQGLDIDSEAPSDRLGTSVSMSADGFSMAIGAPRNDGTGISAGHVRIYKLITGVWTQQGVDIDGEAVVDYMGQSVSMSANGLTVAIGAYLNDGSFSNAGHVRVYSSCVTSIGTDIQTACGSYLWIDNTTYTTSNSTATHTLVGGNANGCDSVVTLNLTINNVDIGVTNTSPTLTANQTGATYQWLNCDNGNAIIPTETNQSYTTTANGNYAVEVTLANCIDTSACENISTVGINENDLNNEISIYPNPTTGLFTLHLTSIKTNARVTVCDMLGKVILSKKSITTNTQIDLTENNKGIYFVNIQTNNEKIVRKIILQ
jgi:hypothetical protein